MYCKLSPVFVLQAFTEQDLRCLFTKQAIDSLGNIQEAQEEQVNLLSCCSCNECENT